MKVLFGVDVGGTDIKLGAFDWKSQKLLKKWAIKTDLSNEGKQIFVMGHPEYDRITLDKEYHRDLEKGLPIDLPYNYYPNDDATKRPLLQWRANSNNLFSNWLNYYVYQVTPYEL